MDGNSNPNAIADTAAILPSELALLLGFAPPSSARLVALSVSLACDGDEEITVKAFEPRGVDTASRMYATDLAWTIVVVGGGRIGRFKCGKREIVVFLSDFRRQLCTR